MTATTKPLHLNFRLEREIDHANAERAEAKKFEAQGRHLRADAARKRFRWHLDNIDALRALGAK